MTRSPMDILFDGAKMKCTKCGVSQETGCDCWTKCDCGWSFEKGGECRNPAHTKTPEGTPLGITHEWCILGEDE